MFGCRLIAQQTQQTITPHCGQAGNSYPQCNCSRNSILMPPSAPSLQYIGRQPIMCPYYYYTEPRAEYPGSTPCGYWYSLPKAGECSSSDGHPLGVSGTCTWSRQPFATIVYGDDLLHEGFDKRLSFDQYTGARLNTTEQSLFNAGIIDKALNGGRIREYLQMQPCGSQGS